MLKRVNHGNKDKMYISKQGQHLILIDKGVYFPKQMYVLLIFAGLEEGQYLTCH